MFAIAVPYIDPVITQLGPLAIRWYSLAYIFGIFFGIAQFKYLAGKAKLKLSRNFIDDFITGIVIGIILGGRIGYVLIYDPMHYLANPLDIFKTWNGGMSFHGGFLGFCIATVIVCRMHNIRLFSLFDIAACCAPIGIFLGRIANFINGELFGRATDMPWGITVIDTDDMVRHPSQLYEAFSEGILLYAILALAFFKFKLYKKVGMLSGIFCLGYATFRCVCELFRQPDAQIGYIFGFITMGQILSLVMFALALIIFRQSYKGNL